MTEQKSPVHIMAVAGLVANAHGQVLMLQSPRGDWEFPGGQVETGETLIQALEREILEETGAVATVKSLVGLYSNLHASPILMADFICEYISGQLRESPESLKVEWVDKADVLFRISRPSIRGGMKKMLEFSGQITYRAYRVDAYDVNAPYEIYEDRLI